MESRVSASFAHVVDQRHHSSPASPCLSPLSRSNALTFDTPHTADMTDRLTQLQDAVDQLTTQFFSALRYVGNKHESAPVGNEDRVPDDKHHPDKPAVFEGALFHCNIYFGISMLILHSCIVGTRARYHR